MAHQICVACEDKALRTSSWLVIGCRLPIATKPDLAKISPFRRQFFFYLTNNNFIIFFSFTELIDKIIRYLKNILIKTCWLANNNFKYYTIITICFFPNTGKGNIWNIVHIYSLKLDSFTENSFFLKKGLNIRQDTIKLLEENIGKIFWYQPYKCFLGSISQANRNKSKK